MRQLKARVWTGAQMEYNITVGKFGAFYVNPGSKGDGLDEKDAASLTPFNTKYPESAPVMQYTGLKDKTGKEIYEGDIVKTKYQKSAVVRWMDEEACFATETIDDIVKGEIMYSMEDINEVIGNIFVNPELLNK